MPKKADIADSDGSKLPGRSYTVSIAVAGSGIDNTMSLELATLVGISPHRSYSLMTENRRDCNVVFPISFLQIEWLL
jgi:hypothetical protein